jgi:hypothetical protein
MNGFTELFSEFDDLGAILIVSSNFTLINEIMNSTPKKSKIQVVSHPIEWNSLEARNDKWDLLIYFDSPELWEKEEDENLPKKFLNYADIVMGSFPSPASKFCHEGNHWPSYFSQLLKAELGLNVSTYMRSYFWDDEIVPIDFTQSLITYSMNHKLKDSDFPLDCIHPANIGLQKVDSTHKIYKSKLRVHLVSLISPSTRKQLKKLLPSSLVRKIRGWIRS